MKSKLNCVMIIDDDEPTNFLTQMIVEKSGCTDHVAVLQSGKDALDYLTHCNQSGDGANNFPSPSLIFLDINMPAMNGWEFLDNYKKLSKERKAKIIVVMLTTSLFPEDVSKARDIHEVSGFENKPLTAEKLNKVLKKYFASTSIA